MKINCAYDDLVEIHKLVPHPKNPNKHPKDQIERLAKIIDYQGMRSPIVVSTLSGFITKGHGRLEALKLLGWEKVPVDYQDYENDAQEYSDIVADNAIADWAAQDLSMINTEMLDLGPDFDVDLLGIKDFTIEPIEKYDEETQDDVPEVTHNPITKRGDIWLLGEHRIMCGDSTMIDDVEKLMQGEKADMVFTDPPYNVAYEGKTKDKLTIKNDSMNTCDFNQFLKDSFNSLASQCKMGASFYVAYPDRESLNFHDAFLSAGCKLSSVVIWNKNSMVIGRSDYHSKHEPIIYGWKEGAAHNWFSDRNQVSVFNCQRPTANKIHPTMKPIELIEYFINNSSKKNWIVIDFFLGSGSTLIACEKTNRKCYGMELDEHYCDVIVERWQKFTNKKATLEGSNKTYDELKNEREK